MFGRSLKVIARHTVSIAEMSTKSSGKVKFFNPKKGFGFILPNDGSPEIFVHQTSIFKEGFRSLADGEDVEYEIAVSPESGKLTAINVTGPNGKPVLGQLSSVRDYTGRDFQDRGEQPRRYRESDGTRSYPKRPYTPPGSQAAPQETSQGVSHDA